MTQLQIRRFVFGLIIFVFSASFGAAQTIDSYMVVRQDSVSKQFNLDSLRADTTAMGIDSLRSSADTARSNLSDTLTARRDTVSTRRDTLNIITSDAGANTVRGFRVQLESTQDLLDAVSTETLADSLLPGYNVYIVYDAPYYKVRVGDFRARYQAEQAVSYMASHGFPDAWSVPDNVFRNPRPRR